MTHPVSLHIDENTGWRGGEQQVAYLVEGLAARGQPVLLAGRPNGALLNRFHQHPGVLRLAAPFRGEWDLYSAWCVSRAIRAHRVDIVHAHTGHAHAFASLAVRMARRGHVVITRRVDVTPRKNSFSRWKYRQTQHVIAISQCIADIMRQYGIPESRISIIGSVQDPARFDTAPADRATLGIAPDAPLLLCAAALAEHKDHATLIKAMSKVVAKHPEARLLLAGDGPLRGTIEKHIAHLNLQEQVWVLGFRQDIPALMGAADGFVLSSHMEGLGSVLIEAMMCELPIVATAAGGIPELIRHGHNGLLVPPRDPEAMARALLQLIEDRALRLQLGAEGKAFALRHATPEALVDEYVALYERLVNNGTHVSD